MGQLMASNIQIKAVKINIKQRKLGNVFIFEKL